MSIRHRKPSRRWRGAIAVLATAAVLSTAACAPGGAPADDAPTTLTVATSGAPASFDPAFLDQGQSTYIWTGVYDTLLWLDNDKKIQPNAAESWTYSDDALTLTLTLREGMTFSTGDPVTAAAVKATLEYVQATPGPRTGDISDIASVEAPDDRTVVINLTTPSPSLLVNLASASGVIADPATLETERTALDPVGSGPYVLNTEKSVTGSTYVLDRREDYWNVDEYPFETLTVRVVADRQASFNALQSGEIDAANINADQTEIVEAAGFDAKIVRGMGTGTLGLFDRTGEKFAPLGDLRVRQAIMMAFDRELYVTQLTQGTGTPSVQIFSPEGPVFDPELEKLYPYDPEKAKELLADAGYPDGFEIELPSTFLTQGFEPSLTQSLLDIGITTTWTPVPAQEVGTTTQGKWPIAFFIDGFRTPEVELQNNFDPTGYLNPYGVQGDAELEKLMADVAVEVDQDAALDGYREINRYIVENALTVPVFATGTVWATKPGIDFLPDSGGQLLSVRTFAPGE